MHLFKKKNIVEEVADKSKKLQPGLRELVLGRKTIFSLLSFGIGTVMVGNFIWSLSSSYFGNFSAALIGLTMFLIGGMIGREFKK